MKTLLAVEIYYFTEQDFHHMREPVMDYSPEHFWKSMPEWCVRDDTGRINWARAYHQWAGYEGTNDGKKYMLFDINPIDGILQEEISNVGFEDFFGDYDFRPIFEKLYINEAPIRRLTIPHTQYLVVDLIYHGMGEDADLEVEIVGYLDSNLKFKEL
jgi:hypothetical protein